MRRPWSVTFLAILVLFFTAIFIVRTIQSLKLWDFLDSLQLTVSPLYLALTGLIWALVGLVLVEGLWSGRSWARRALQGASLGYAVFYWIDRLFLAADTLLEWAWPSRLGATLGLLLLVFWILSRPIAKAYFAPE